MFAALVGLKYHVVSARAALVAPDIILVSFRTFPFDLAKIPAIVELGIQLGDLAATSGYIFSNLHSDSELLAGGIQLVRISVCKGDRIIVNRT
jgi:hypothetical protein